MKKRKKLKRYNPKRVDEILDYILQFEEEDFKFWDQNPDENHVYYKALHLKYGKKSADAVLKGVRAR